DRQDEAWVTERREPEPGTTGAPPATVNTLKARGDDGTATVDDGGPRVLHNPRRVDGEDPDWVPWTVDTRKRPGEVGAPPATIANLPRTEEPAPADGQSQPRVLDGERHRLDGEAADPNPWVIKPPEPKHDAGTPAGTGPEGRQFTGTPHRLDGQDPDPTPQTPTAH